MGAIAIGVLSGLIASIVFVVALRLIMHPRILISDEIAHDLSQEGHEIYRVKIRNARRHSEAVKLQFDMVVLTPVVTPAPPVDGLRRWRFFAVEGPHPHKFERAAVTIRPETLISLPKYDIADREANYAIRLTSRDCPEIQSALAHSQKILRLKVYAEHPWSGRGKTVEKLFTTASCVVCGDFPAGPSLDVVRNDATESTLAAITRVTMAPQLEAAPDAGDPPAAT